MEKNDCRFLYVSNARSVSGEPLNILVCKDVDRKAVIRKIGRAEIAALPERTKRYDAGGAVIFPAFTDLAGFPDRHNSAGAITAETASALCGGFQRTVSLDPTFDLTVYAERKKRAAASAKTDVVVSAGLSENSDPMDFYRAGARVFTDLNSPVLSVRKMLSVFSSVPDDALFLLSCRDPEGETGFSDGMVAKKLSLPGTPPVSEELAVLRAITLSAESGRKIHLTGLSTARALGHVRRAKAEGIAVTCDVPAYSLSFVSTDLYYYGARAKLSPPLRTESDRNAVKEALADGTADAVSSCHFPCYDREKKKLADAVPGAVGYQTVFSAVMTELVLPGTVPMRRAAEILALNPASILGIDAELRENGPADFVLTDPYREWIVTADILRGRSVQTPYLGGSLNGAVLHTVRNGEWL